MSAAAELKTIVLELQNTDVSHGVKLPPNFEGILDETREALLASCTMRATALLNTQLGLINQFSQALERTQVYVLNRSVKERTGEALNTMRAALKHLEYLESTSHTTKPSVPSPPPYVATSRILELQRMKSSHWDLTRLVRMCEELNTAYTSGCLMATGMLVRAIVDHVPPVFGCRNFDEYVNNRAPKRDSFKDQMSHLQNSLRKTADLYLHAPISSKESLPTSQAVRYEPDLDALLAEVIRTLSKASG